MSENRMLIVTADLAKKIDENRGDYSREKFIDFLISSRLEQKVASAEEQYVTKEDLAQFQQDIRDLLRSFMEFYVNYGLEFGRTSDDKDAEGLSQRLQELGISAEGSKKRKN